MLLSPKSIEKQLATHSPYSRLFVAYSGGIDSHVLLHLCASLAHLKDLITAVYINHGLQKEAESWGEHCEFICKQLGVKFLAIDVNAHAVPGESPEEAARNARYTALKPLLGNGDLLLLAQHSDDQLETVLLQLFRGSGLKGLSGMPGSIPFGQGTMLRPLLEVSKAAIIDYAKEHALAWIEDPSNRQTQFDRNFLRNDIIPLLKQRWPSLDKTVSRSANHCTNAQSLISSLSNDLLEQLIDHKDSTLKLNALQNFSTPEQQLIIRQWFHSLGLKMPSQNVVQRILQDIVGARDDADPVFQKREYSIRRYRDKLYYLNTSHLKAKPTVVWPAKGTILKITENCVYEIVTSHKGIPCERWNNSVVSVKFRSGGENIRLPGRVSRHSLKKLYQEAGIPPWERSLIPLIYLDEKLAAVGERWISSEFYSAKKEPCFLIIRQQMNPAND